jgi:hypothetical protein
MEVSVIYGQHDMQSINSASPGSKWSLGARIARVKYDDKDGLEMHAIRADGAIEEKPFLTMSADRKQMTLNLLKVPQFGSKRKRDQVDAPMPADGAAAATDAAPPAKKRKVAKDPDAPKKRKPMTDDQKAARKKKSAETKAAAAALEKGDAAADGTVADFGE